MLVFSPFTSAEVLVALVGVNAIATGVLLLVAHDEATSGNPELLGIGWLLLGIIILARPGFSVAALAVVVGVALVITGLLGVVAALRGQQRTGWDRAPPPSSAAWPRSSSASWR